MGRAMETGTHQDLFYVAIRQSMIPYHHQATCEGGDLLRIHCVSYVEGQQHWHISYQGARQFFSREDTDGDMLRCYKLLQTYLETEQRKKRPDLKHEKPAIQFVKAGEKAQTTASNQGGLLSGALTWEMRVQI